MWWLPAVSLLAVGTLFYVMSALHVLSFSPLIAGRQEAARDDAVREALERHTAPSSAGNPRVAPTIQLRAGEHPGAEPLDIPVPPDARLAGARSREDGRDTHIRDRALFATSGDVADVRDSVRLPGDLVPGEYTISVAIVGEKDEKPVVRLGIKGRSDDGWYPLSKLSVTR